MAITTTSNNFEMEERYGVTYLCYILERKVNM